MRACILEDSMRIQPIQLWLGSGHCRNKAGSRCHAESSFGTPSSFRRFLDLFGFLAACRSIDGHFCLIVLFGRRLCHRRKSCLQYRLRSNGRCFLARCLLKFNSAMRIWRCYDIVILRAAEEVICVEQPNRQLPGSLLACYVTEGIHFATGLVRNTRSVAVNILPRLHSLQQALSVPLLREKPLAESILLRIPILNVLGQEDQALEEHTVVWARLTA
mmetsp:Transcript_138239/g.345009  ORF Transcript_138239/g.345009 Transcript_138239/m.345009 type:complete len:217 (+) Transcript_138239:114-764(+)